MSECCSRRIPAFLSCPCSVFPPSLPLLIRVGPLSVCPHLKKGFRKGGSDSEFRSTTQQQLGGGGLRASLLSILTERYLWSCRPLTSHIFFCALFCLPPVHT